MMSASKNSQSGFSLIEMLVAVVILAVGLLGLAQLQVTAIKANAQSASSTAANAIAQDGIEQIIAMDADDSRLDDSGNFSLPSVATEGGGTYSVTATVVTPYEGVTNLCKITIVVTSTTAVMNVLGNKVRDVTVHTLKRSI
jgi:type IV pilus assembly protein PilV